MAKTITGIVSSNKPDKTIIVTVHLHKTHPIYKKKYSFSRKFMAHDQNNEAQVGDRVIISETRPLSARKRYTLDKIIERAGVKHEEADVPDVVVEAEASPKSKKESK